MNTFPLKIVTPDGLQFEGMAEKLVVRTAAGDVAILANHMDYVVSLGMGQAILEAEGSRRYGACIGGMLSVLAGSVTLVPTTFEWADAIDVERADRSEKLARQVLAQPDASDRDIRIAQARLKRALIRKSTAEHHFSK